MPKGTSRKELDFQKAYKAHAAANRLNPNPDDPLHFYDYRKAYRAGELKTDSKGHGTSKYKLEGHPNLYKHPTKEKYSSQPRKDWIDTRTNKAVK